MAHRKGINGSEAYDLACGLARRFDYAVRQSHRESPDMQEAMEAERQFIVHCLHAGADRRLSASDRALLDGWMQHQEYKHQAIMASIIREQEQRAAKAVA